MSYACGGGGKPGIPSAASVVFFFFNDTATTEIYTLSLHDALPILSLRAFSRRTPLRAACTFWVACKKELTMLSRDRKSTRLNSSHSQISYAVFCLKKKKPRARRDGAARRGARTPTANLLPTRAART